MRRWRFRGDTSRQADLYGSIVSADTTDLGTLRKFVAKLDQWPDNAKVRAANGMVLRVSMWHAADPLTTDQEDETDGC